MTGEAFTERQMIRKIVKWIAKNSHRSSILLSPTVSYSVDATELLDAIAEITNITDDTFTRWVDEAHEENEIDGTKT